MKRIDAEVQQVLARLLACSTSVPRPSLLPWRFQDPHLCCSQSILCDDFRRRYLGWPVSFETLLAEEALRTFAR